MLLVENVKKSYREPDGSTLAILDVPQLSVAKGEQVVIRGRSGGGKTTLLNSIAGLTTVDSGRILLNGTDVGAASLQAFERELIAMFTSLQFQCPF